jgi:Ni,Fe-hydrogenase III large subunit
MSLQSVILEKGLSVEAHKPWPRAVVDTDLWQLATFGAAAGEATLLGLWSDGEAVHMALMEEPAGEPFVLSVRCPERRFPSVGRSHPPALRLERAISDVYGLIPEGLPDTRPWLDHGRWGVKQPLGSRERVTASGTGYAFHKAEGAPLHQIPVGPVHAGIIEPGHFRFTANGETVVRLETRLGYVHKGIEALMIDAPLDRAAKLAGRVSGDSTVAYSIAFARAVEAAVGFESPARATRLRAVMAEMERLANHFGDIGAICNDASFSLMHAHCGALREQVLRAAHACFGHRLMMDRVVPGGVASDLDDDGVRTLRGLIADIRKTFSELVELYDNTASLQDRTVRTGVLKPELARQYAAGGYVGRASGRSFDARRAPGYPPYTELDFKVPIRSEGDVDARVWIRIDEVTQSLSIIEQILGQLPRGPVHSTIHPAGQDVGVSEGLALVEGFRGDILAWVRIANNGTIICCHLRDPSWFQWPLLEAAIEGNIVADFPLCNKSFNCSYSGHDL